MKITAIIINGRHGGFVYPNMEYSPTIKLPVINENQISLGEAEDLSVRIGDDITYVECFRSVDKECVLYSQRGKWQELKDHLLYKFQQTYPIKLW